MSFRRLRRQSLSCLLLAVTWAICSQTSVLAQQDNAELAKQIVRLDDPNYRVRSLAIWKLGRHPKASIPLIRGALPAASHHAGSEMIELLMIFVLEGDREDSAQSLAILKTTARRLTSLGRVANNALYSIAGLHEEKAIEMLINHDATIGPRTFSLNGTLGSLTEDALHIDDRFSGDKECVHKIRFIRSLKTVCLEGEKIDRSYLEAVTEMKGVENIKLKNVKLSADDLKLLQKMDNIEHLGLLYMDVGDEVIEVLKQLPISKSMKVYGTKVSRNGHEQLKTSMDGMPIYYGRGGFLGVSPQFASGTQISKVTFGSAAQEAGIKPFDILREVNGVEVKTFADLREELGKYSAGTKVKIKLDRSAVEMEFDVVLKEE